MRLVDLSGKKFGRLTVVRRNEHNDKYNKPMWNCICDCGNEVVVLGNALKNGNTKSCGCYKLEQIRSCETKHHTHRLTNTRLYRIWRGMKKRCFDKNNKDYYNYGGRGISVCNEWKNDFYCFYQWSMNNGYSEELTIDRINANGNYEPTNCRWVTTYVQNRNKNFNVLLTYNGKSQIMSDWSKETGISCGVISRRLKTGWTIEEALTIKPLVGRTNHKKDA